jgi:glycosyltransferase involved in cell wall biosynthesis
MIPLLTILIPTLPQRRALFERLTAEIRSQIQSAQADVEVLADGGIGTVGAKRQRLLEKAQGEYVCFIDDDDWVTPDYIHSLVKACAEGKDAVGFRGWITTDGKKPKDFSISMLHEYTERHNMYFRFHNHLSPVRREIALAVGFKDMSYGEDHDYATRMRPLIKTEVYIDKKLYHYRYVTKK